MCRPVARSTPKTFSSNWNRPLLSRLIAAVFIAFASAPAAFAEGDPVFSFSESDPGMNAAIMAARDTLTAFIDNTMRDGQSGPQSMLKVTVPTATLDEVIWVAPFVQTGEDTWIGALANQPQYIKGANAGDTIEFTSDQIADWAVFDGNGVMFGGYTIREMVESGAVTADMVPMMSDNPLPTGW